MIYILSRRRFNLALDLAWDETQFAEGRRFIRFRQDDELRLSVRLLS